MGFLDRLVRVVLRQLAALGFLIIAPLIYIIPVVLVIVAPDATSLFQMLALGLMVTGPFVSAFWTMIACMCRRVKRMTADGSPYECSLEGGLAATGWMAVGFFGTLVAELLFLLMCQGIPDEKSLHVGWALWFAVAPFVISAPLLLIWAWAKKSRAHEELPTISARGKSKSAETLAIEQHLAEAEAIARKLRREGKDEAAIAEALTKEQLDAVSFDQAAHDPVYQAEQRAYKPGTLGALFYEKYQRYLRETS
jgi:MFS family permease